jgi:hypothetical protein
MTLVDNTPQRRTAFTLSSIYDGSICCAHRLVGAIADSDPLPRARNDRFKAIVSICSALAVSELMDLDDWFAMAGVPSRAFVLRVATSGASLASVRHRGRFGAF